MIVVQEIFRLRDNGNSVRQISERMRISKSSVVLYLLGRLPEKCICTHSFLVKGCTCGYLCR